MAKTKPLVAASVSEPASAVEVWPIEKIIPYDKNPRTHPESQIDLLVRLMSKYGIDQPIVVDERGVIIKGHGRLLAAKKMGRKDFPVAIHRGLSETDKSAIRIADNQSALLSEWDPELLRIELGELRLENYDMPLLGFTDFGLVEAMAPPEADEELELDEKQLTEDQRRRLNIAWKRLAGEWNDFANGKTNVISTEHTKGTLMCQFMRAQLFGDDIVRTATLPYTPHRLAQASGTNGKAWNALFAAALEDVSLLESMRWCAIGKPSFTKILSTNLGIHGYRYPFDFPALLARDLINEFCKKGGHVLDPCHGWGGRMIGFLLSKAATYTGFDVDKKTVAGVTAMFDDLKELADAPKTAELILCQYEKATLASGSFDFALTSPPYYDTEKYDGDLQSWVVYKSFEEWAAGFYLPLIAKTMDALKPGGIFALQIGNQNYPLEKTAIENLPANAEFIETRSTDMINNYTGTEEERGELIMILQRKGAAKKKSDPATKFGRVL